MIFCLRANYGNKIFKMDVILDSILVSQNFIYDFSWSESDNNIFTRKNFSEEYVSPVQFWMIQFVA